MKSKAPTFFSFLLFMLLFSCSSREELISIVLISAEPNPIPTEPDLSTQWYIDSDNDGFGNPDTTMGQMAVFQPVGFIKDNSDCNDADAAINPNTVWYLDSDTDNFAISTQTQCDSPGVGYTLTVLPLTDCNDAMASAFPEAFEIYGDRIDNDCDGLIDEATIGQYRDGGVVFWIDPADSTHGFVCAIEDFFQLEWYNDDFIDTNAVGTAIGTGATNTNLIIAAQGPEETNYAAGAAKAYRGNGYSDWFLPSRDQLIEMYVHKVAINDTALANGGVAFNEWVNYWSSSQTKLYGWLDQAFSVNFAMGNFISQQTNTNVIAMRPVRAF